MKMTLSPGFSRNAGYLSTAALSALLTVSANLAAFPGPGGAMMNPFDEDSMFSNPAESLVKAVEALYADEFEAAKNAYLNAREDYNWLDAEDAGRKARFSLDGKDDPLNLGLADAVLGTALTMQSRFTEAEPILEGAYENLKKELGRDDVYALWALARLAEIRVKQGRFTECLELKKVIPEKAKGQGKPEELRAAIQDARFWPAMAALQLGDFKVAEALINVMLKDTQRSTNKLLIRERAKALSLLATLRRNQSQPQKALTAAKESLSLRKKSAPQTGFEITGLNDLAWQLMQDKKYDEATEIVRSAVKKAKQNLAKSDLVLGQAFLLEAELQHAQGQNIQETEELKSALEVFRAANAREELAKAARLLAKAYARQGDYVKATALFNEALDNIDIMFAATRGLGNNARQYFLRQFMPYYHEAVLFLLDLEKQNASQGYGKQALAVVSRTQSRVFTELLRQALAGLDIGNAKFTSLIAERDRAQKQQDEIEDQLLRLPKAKDDPILQRRIDGLKKSLLAQSQQAANQLTAINDRLWREFPRYMELTEPRPVTVGALQNRYLRNGELVLSYYLQPTQVAIFLISRDRFVVKTVAKKNNEVNDLIHRVRRAMSFEEELNPADLNRLYQFLLKPVAALIPDNSQLVAIGDGPLHALPLEMLITSWTDQDQKAFYQGDGDPYARLNYVDKKWRISYLPSLASLQALRDAQGKLPNYQKHMVSFANPVYETQSSDSFFDYDQPAGNALLVPLQETADEAKGIAAILGGASDLYLGHKAQESTAKRLKPKQSRFLHFATHGLLGGEYLQVKSQTLQAAAKNLSRDQQAIIDAQPALVLSLSGRMNGEDGFLTMTDVIQGLKTDAELVVLSACNTAGEGGRPGGGEGFAGMTRAFMFSGAKGLYVSHWAVESMATMDLMLEAFKQITAGQSPVNALNKARSVVRQGNNRGNPVFWAPFVYVGLPASVSQ